MNDDALDDEIAVGRKVIEMADRVRAMHLACPDAQAVWNFEIDDTRFRVAVTVNPPKPI